MEQVSQIITTSALWQTNFINEENLNNHNLFNQTIGDKRYELSNLPITFGVGNVLEVITDRKVAIDFTNYDPNTGAYTSTIADGSLDYYTADVISQNDYYPFGMLLPNRHEAGNEYRYGYQGSEKDDEVKGEGNSYTTTFRQLDPRVGRWLSIDPKATAWESPYVSMGDNPVFHNDVLGDTVFSKRFLGRKLAHIDGKVFKKNGEEFKKPLKGIHKDVQSRLSKLSSKPNGRDLEEDLEKSEHHIVIKRSARFRNDTYARDENAATTLFAGSGSVIHISREGKIDDVAGFIILGHELQHARNNAEGTSSNQIWYKLYGKVINCDEIEAVHIENLIRTEHGLPLRFFYTQNYESSRTVNINGVSIFYNIDYNNKVLKTVKAIENEIFPIPDLHPSMK